MAALCVVKNMIKLDGNGVPDFQSLMLQVLRSCQESEVRIRDVAEQLAKDLTLSDAAVAHRNASGSQTIFYNRKNWAKTHLGKAGLLESTRRAYFRITENGRHVLSKNLSARTRRFRRNFRTNVRLQNGMVVC